MSARKAVVDYFGLSAPSSTEPGEQIPLWWGADARFRRISAVGWFLVALAFYGFVSWAMPQDDGLGGYAPLIMSVLLFSTGSMLTERSALRFPRNDSHARRDGGRPGVV